MTLKEAKILIAINQATSNIYNYTLRMHLMSVYLQRYDIFSNSKSFFVVFTWQQFWLYITMTFNDPDLDCNQPGSFTCIYPNTRFLWFSYTNMTFTNILFCFKYHGAIVATAYVPTSTANFMANKQIMTDEGPSMIRNLVNDNHWEGWGGKGYTVVHSNSTNPICPT